MSYKDFKRLVRDGFKLKHKKDNTDLRCFNCGAEIGLERKINKKGKVYYKFKCENGHRWSYINFMERLVDMRDGVAKVILRGDCSYSKVRPE